MATTIQLDPEIDTRVEQLAKATGSTKEFDHCFGMSSICG
jgi:predicted transcriptional regulator